jgi:hypothetical protein
MLMMMSRPASERGGVGERAFLAFKLHRFISGAGHVYATLRGAGRRRVTLDGQRFDPRDPDARLYATFFCRNCGQEHHPVVLVADGGVTRVLPRPIDETPLDETEDWEQAGYLMPEPEGDADYAFTGALEDYPEDWLEGQHSAPEQPAPLRTAGNHGGTWRSSRHFRTPGVVFAWQVPLLPCVQGSAGKPGT